MRFLVSLILSSFFFIAPSKSNAGEIWERQAAWLHVSQVIAPDGSDHCLSGGYIKTLTQISNRTGSATPYRLYPLTNFAGTGFYQRRPVQVYNGKYFIEPYTYCKRFGLRLIFPEHYYW